MDIKEQIEWIRGICGEPSNVKDANEIADTLEALNKVYEAANELRRVLRGRVDTPTDIIGEISQKLVALDNSVEAIEELEGK